MAPLFYRNVMWQDGGPIRKIDFYKSNHDYSAYAYLNSNLLPGWGKNSQIFDNVDGAGTHKRKNIAIHKAISEALERWAFYFCFESANKSLYGFDLNPSTTGMASYPSFSTKPARLHAFCEAIERWGLVQWWHQKLSHSLIYISKNQIHFEAIQIPFKTVQMVLAWFYDQKEESLFYGFAVSKKRSQALEQALVELNRKKTVVKNYLKHNPGCSVEYLISRLKFKNEKRLLYYCLGPGKFFFLDRVKEKYFKKQGKSPRLCRDIEIKGPWTAYTKVWRCLFEVDKEESFSNQDYQEFHV